MKYDIKMSCGHIEERQLFGKGKTREETISWLEREGLCKECYKKRKEEAAARKKAARMTKKIKWNKKRIMKRAWNIRKGNTEILFSDALRQSWAIERKLERRDLQLHIEVLPKLLKGEIEVYLRIRGEDTREFKEEIKKINYHWNDDESSGNFFGFSNTKVWQKYTTLPELEKEIEKAEEIGATLVDDIQNIFTYANYQIAIKKKIQFDKMKKELNELKKPERPTKLVGHKWNGRVYGKKGPFTIHLSGEKIEISKKEKEEFENYLEAQSEYEKKANEIKISYGYF